MTYHKDLMPLRDVFASLYPAESIARVVVGDAGISEKLIDFDGAAVEFWKNILTIAQSNRQVQALIDVAREHFPQNEALIDAEQIFHTIPEQILSGVEEDRGNQPADAGSNVVFNQERQRVRKQINVAGDYKEQ